MPRRKPRPDPSGTRGAIDSASIHAALSALLVGKERLLGSAWELQSLLEVTYLLLHGNMRVIPGPGGYRGPSGPYQLVLARFPELEEPAPAERQQAMASAKAWATRNPEVLRTAMDRLRDDPVARSYLDHQMACFWEHHVRMYGGLFNAEFIPQIAVVMQCSEKDLRDVHGASSDSGLVAQWAHSSRAGEAARIAEDAWLLASLVRGRHHEYLARATGVQLVAHPFRRGVQLELRGGVSKDVSRAEEYFSRILIGSALSERSSEKRIQRWIDNVHKARIGILAETVALPPKAEGALAERHAVAAARELELAGGSRVLARAIDLTVSWRLPALVAVAVAPWAGPDVLPLAAYLSPVVAQLYKHSRNVSVGDDLAKATRATRAQFAALAKLAPGRIERTLR